MLRRESFMHFQCVISYSPSLSPSACVSVYYPFGLSSDFILARSLSAPIRPRWVCLLQVDRSRLKQSPVKYRQMQATSTFSSSLECHHHQRANNTTRPDWAFPLRQAYCSLLQRYRWLSKWRWPHQTVPLSNSSNHQASTPAHKHTGEPSRLHLKVI